MGNDWLAELPATGHPALVLHLLKHHPFPVVAWFDRVVAVSFAFPEEVLREGLESTCDGWFLAEMIRWRVPVPFVRSFGLEGDVDLLELIRTQ